VNHYYTLTYDAWNRLVKVEDDQQTPATAAEYRYDGLNRRVAKMVPDGQNWDRTDYYYNSGWQALEERFADAQADKDAVASAVEVQWVWSARYIDAPVLRDRNNDQDPDLEERLYYTTDANMNVTALVDTSGTVQERYTYDPYGKVTLRDGSWNLLTWNQSKQNEVLYCGYRFDSETGLYHVRHRYFHPPLGRWLSRDPIGYADGMGLYLYGAPSSLAKPDSTGLTAMDAWDKLRGRSLKKAIGIGAHFYLQVKVAEPDLLYELLTGRDLVSTWTGFTGGAGGVFMFFPDTCELAEYHTFAGAVRNKVRRDAGDAPDTPQERFWRTKTEAGIGSGIGWAVQGAWHIGSGEASADSFQGPFHTVYLDLPPPAPPVGGSIYIGEPKPGEGTWYGFTVGMGAAIGVGKITWEYRMQGKLDLDDYGTPGTCLCYALILALPQQLRTINEDLSSAVGDLEDAMEAYERSRAEEAYREYQRKMYEWQRPRDIPFPW
jgi:RHS repeat-associated protein